MHLHLKKCLLNGSIRMDTDGFSVIVPTSLLRMKYFHYYELHLHFFIFPVNQFRLLLFQLSTSEILSVCLLCILHRIGILSIFRHFSVHFEHVVGNSGLIVVIR
jgi:hypothetical protein